MSDWMRTSNSRKSLNVWADDVASEVMKEKTQSASSAGTRPTASTTVRGSYGLPPPATHGERYSIASGVRKRKHARFGLLKTVWTHFKRRLGTGSAPSSTSIFDSAPDSIPINKVEGTYQDSVDEVVVDRVWSDEFHSTPSNSDPGDESSPKSGSNEQHIDFSDSGSTSHTANLAARLAHVVMEVFSSRFEDERKENHYQQVRRQSSLFGPYSLCTSRRIGMSRNEWPSARLFGF